MKEQTLGDRMKDYESASQNTLIRRTPVLIRLDGKAFHTFTADLERPFDKGFREAMAETALALCEQIQGAVFAYTQSDEISILIQDWKNPNTDCWYGNNVQKMVSVSASITTATFNAIFKRPNKTELALFDSRAFNLPEHEIVNYFIWRGSDCSRNSLSTLARFYFTHKELQGKNGSQMQDMLMESHGVNWNDLSAMYKRGVCVLPTEERGFRIDYEPPMFTKKRDYIENTFKFS